MNWLLFWRNDEDLGRFLRIAERVTFIALGAAVGGALSEALPFGEWLFRWSSLLAGMLAVGAALITVGAMIRVDGRAQVRHFEILQLNTRADRLRILRARTPYAGLIRLCAAQCERWAETLNETQWSSQQHVTDAINEGDKCLRALRDTFKAPEIAGVVDLLDPEANMAKADVSSADAKMDLFSANLSMELMTSDIEVMSDVVRAAVPEYQDAVKRLASAARVYAGELDRIADGYG